MNPSSVPIAARFFRDRRGTEPWCWTPRPCRVDRDVQAHTQPHRVAAEDRALLEDDDSLFVRISATAPCSIHSRMNSRMIGWRVTSSPVADADGRYLAAPAARPTYSSAGSCPQPLRTHREPLVAETGCTPQRGPRGVGRTYGDAEARRWGTALVDVLDGMRGAVRVSQRERMEFKAFSASRLSEAAAR